MVEVLGYLEGLTLFCVLNGEVGRGLSASPDGMSQSFEVDLCPCCDLVAREPSTIGFDRNLYCLAT